jgi:hypothetical protein
MNTFAKAFTNYYLDDMIEQINKFASKRCCDIITLSYLAHEEALGKMWTAIVIFKKRR